ncbi:MAG: phosphoenolpyruvate--protein phosphotransferase, partial [Gemmatimonadaceae bacterium]
MALHCTFICPLPNGLHARPATAFEHVVRGFVSDVTLVSERTGASTNAKSVLGIVGLDIRQGDQCRITIEGVDEPEASAAIARFLERDLAHCDDAIPAAAARPGERTLPRMLLQADGGILHGTPMVPGIGHGRALIIDGFTIPDVLARARTDDPDAELARLEAGLRALDAQYEEELAEDGPDVAASIIRAHHAIARDPALHDHLKMSVRKHHLTVAGAIAAADTFFSGMLAASESALLRERALDVGDVCRELFEVIHGSTKVSARAHLSADTVCIAENLTPREFLALDRRFLKGLVLEFAASTSHTIVLARSFGIPTLTGVTGLRPATLGERDVIVDADLGVLITEGTAGTHRYYEMEQARLAGRRDQLRLAATTRAETRDGQAMEIGANIATGDETVAAMAEGADGVGLFRTEMLFLNRDDPPGEEEQFEEYRRALVAAAGKPVIIRTLDIGGDKPVPYLRMPHEENPYLGFRAVRMYREFETMVRTQVRALVRASAFGDLRVMVPMISRLEEAEFMRQMVAEEQARCTRDGHVFAPLMQVGAMVEVPAMAFQLDHFCQALDFFSIGTNDLLQYFGAVDRDNDKVAHLHDA